MSQADDERLARRIAEFGQRDCYQVDEVLKESPYEVTQRVSLIGADGSVRWPYVRKFIKRESGLGGAYERLFAAQREGHRFRHIPAIQECYERDGELVVVMEFVAGETLEECVSRRGPSVSCASDVFPQLCDAVIELHEEFDPPLIHRDLKPANVILPKGGLVLVDFGIAREYRDGARADTVRVGTCSFAPPEQFGFGQTTVRSDVFALGMTLYYCLIGSVPDTYVAERDLADARIPPAIREVIAQATSFDPAHRYASVRDLKVAFESALRTVSGCGAESVKAVVEPTGKAADRLTVIGRIWNVAVIVALVVFLCACGLTFTDPKPGESQGPAWVNALTYLVFMPVFFTSVAWLLFDKRRLAQRFPVLQKYSFRHWVLVCFVVFAVMFLEVGLTASLVGAAA